MNNFNLRQKLEPAIIAFSNSLDIIKQQIDDEKAEVIKQQNIYVDKNRALDERIKQVNKTEKEWKDKHKEEILICSNMQVDLQVEIDRNKTVNQKITKIEYDTNQTLKNIEAEKNLAQKNRTDLDISIKAYKDKLIGLQSEVDSIQKKNQESITMWRNNKNKELELIRREEMVIKDQHDLSIREINIKQKQKNLELEVKRAKVNV